MFIVTIFVDYIIDIILFYIVEKVQKVDCVVCWTAQSKPTFCLKKIIYGLHKLNINVTYMLQKVFLATCTLLSQVHFWVFISMIFLWLLGFFKHM